ncbi:mitochondrial fission ELM1 family protein [Thalassospira australica]|uniref:mitochondrial fission ELM1 family protein n=1 Tax=Thalassospira australica TaxID=1528106 RepID=UPI00051A1856|nr:mitochondrial fission ELM1 family protein [Thalassospira australica]
MSDQDTHLIWVLADDRAGNVSQAVGVAEALAQPFKRVDIGYTKLARLPNIIRGASLIGIDEVSKNRLVAPWPDLVISAGRRTAPVARWIKKQSRGHTRICQIMRPDGGENAFDLIAVPAHDRMTVRENIVELPGAPHRVTETRLLVEADKWRAHFKGLPGPRFAVIIGGSTKKTTFTRAMAEEVISRAIEAASAVDGSLLVTTSRRTGRDCEELIADRLAASGVAYHLHDWTSQDENPYFGYLALADVLIVTSDSVSMCCEAAAASGGVYIYAPTGLASERHQRLHQTLFEGGFARPLLPETELVPFSHPSLQPARLVAQRCMEFLGS